MLKILARSLFVFFFSSSLFADTSFVAMGHLKYVMDDEKLITQLFSKINTLNPDYLFVLGDSMLQNKDVVDLFREKFEDRVFFSPGNGDMVNGGLVQYEKNIGYLDHVIESDNARLILFNSLESVDNIKNFLSKSINKNHKKLQILLTHHRVWDDTLTSKFPYSHDKSYYFKDLYPLLSTNVKAIFSGNSKRQYFSDYRVMSSKQNVNNIYWVDKVGDINCYSIGAGDGIPKLGFVYVNLSDQHIRVEPFYVSKNPIEPIPIENLRQDVSSYKPDIYSNKNIDNIEYSDTYIKRLAKGIYNYKMFFIVAFIAIFFGFILGFFYRNKVKNG